MFKKRSHKDGKRKHSKTEKAKKEKITTRKRKQKRVYDEQVYLAYLRARVTATPDEVEPKTEIVIADGCDFTLTTMNLTEKALDTRRDNRTARKMRYTGALASFLRKYRY